MITGNNCKVYGNGKINYFDNTIIGPLAIQNADFSIRSSTNPTMVGGSNGLTTTNYGWTFNVDNTNMYMYLFGWATDSYWNINFNFTTNPNSFLDIQMSNNTTGNASISQTLSFPEAGTYTISLYAAPRIQYYSTNQSLSMFIDTTQIITNWTPTAAGATAVLLTSNPFTVTTGYHTLKIQTSMTTNPGDSSLGITGISIYKVIISIPSGLIFNLDANKNITYNGSNAVTSWTDTNNSITTTSSSGTAPTYSATAINNKPALFFGSGQILTTSSLTPSNPTSLTVFMVVYSNNYYNGGGFNHLLATHGAWVTGAIHNFTNNFCVYSTNYNVGYTFTNGNSYIITINYTSATSFTVRVNGVLTATNSISNSYYKISQIDIGNWDQGTTQRYFNGYIGQMIFFNNSLSSSDVSNIEASLSNKWQIAIGSTPSISSNNILGL